MFDDSVYLIGALHSQGKKNGQRKRSKEERHVNIKQENVNLINFFGMKDE